MLSSIPTARSMLLVIAKFANERENVKHKGCSLVTRQNNYFARMRPYTTRTQQCTYHTHICLAKRIQARANTRVHAHTHTAATSQVQAKVYDSSTPWLEGKVCFVDAVVQPTTNTPGNVHTPHTHHTIPTHTHHTTHNRHTTYIIQSTRSLSDTVFLLEGRC